MSAELPAPLVPAEVDLTGYPFMPLYGHRLFGSDFNATADDTAWRAGVTLWWAAWNQRPAASLPDDDAILARLAGFGRDIKTWKRCRSVALHGFLKCSDDRLYHRALAPLAIEAWDRRVKERERKEKWREKKAGQERPGDGDRDVPKASQTAGQNGREGQGQGQGHIPIPENPPPAAPLGAREKSRAEARGARLPVDWSLTPEWRDMADEARLRHVLPAINLDLEAEKFAGYWHAKTGVNATKLDWRATWINWCLRAEKGGMNGHGNRPAAAHRNGFAQLAAEEINRSVDGADLPGQRRDGPARAPVAAAREPDGG